MVELLDSVDWNEWRRIQPNLPAINPQQAKQITVAHAIIADGVAHEIGEIERVALLVLKLGQINSTKAAAKSIRYALREIEQSVLACQQEIDLQEFE